MDDPTGCMHDSRVVEPPSCAIFHSNWFRNTLVNMKFSVPDFVKIKGGADKELIGCHGFVWATGPKTIWIFLVEGPRKGHVVSKHNMKFVVKAPESVQEIFGSHYSKSNSANDIFVAMPKDHKYTIQDVKRVFEQAMYCHVKHALMFPSSRNVLLSFDDTDAVKKIMTKKTIMIGTSRCRFGLYFGAAAVQQQDAALLENTAPCAKFPQKRPSPETANSRAAAFKNAPSVKRRRFS